jgi:hypothetical protein
LSHFCEKARRALDYVGVTYDEEKHVPAAHIFAAKRAGGRRTVPCLTRRSRCSPSRRRVARWPSFDRSSPCCDGRVGLVGDRFTCADLTFAALAWPALRPPEHPIRYPSDRVLALGRRERQIRTCGGPQSSGAVRSHGVTGELSFAPMTPRVSLVFSLLAALGLFSSAVAHADPVPLAPWHLGVTPSLGGGIAAMTSGGTFPKLIGLTTFGGEVDASYVRLGLFGRVIFNSSGSAGQWTGWTYTLGPTYRLFGDGYDAFALILRGGLTYEHWLAQTDGCAVILFFPNSCSNLPAPALSGVMTTNGPQPIDIETDMIGLTAGVRLELPLKPVYLGFDAELTGVAALESGAPGQMIELRTALVFGFRDRRDAGRKLRERRDPRLPHGSTF